MRATTAVFIAMRNIGDSQDKGDVFYGQLKECVLWMAQKLSNISMATRIVVGFGRTQEDAIKALEVKGTQGAGLGREVQGLLDSVMGDTGADDFMPASRIEGDDYVA